jgi:hypothetical protein
MGKGALHNPTLGNNDKALLPVERSEISTSSLAFKELLSKILVTTICFLVH